MQSKPTNIGTVNIGADYTEEQRTVIRAVDAYRTMRQRTFLTACEFLEILRSLGYRKVAEPTDLPTYEQINRRTS